MLRRTIRTWRARVARRLGVPLTLLGLVAGASPLTSIVAAQATTASSSRYLVILKSANDAAGKSAIARFGGKLVHSNKLGIAVADSADPAFMTNLRASGKVDDVARDAAWREASLSDREPPPVPGPQTITGCLNQYNPPGGVGVGPDPLSVCQWDMRMINASPSGSYAVNQGQGARVGILDTGLDVTHPDIAPNLNLAESCSFILPGTPSSLPVNCPTKSAVQDYFGHGTHVGGEVAAPINGIGVAGVAPRATLIGLHAGTAIGGYFFTSSVVNGLIYAGDHHLDVVNMSFFADPFLYNCKNDSTPSANTFPVGLSQKAIVKAISKAAAYAVHNGVVLVAAAGNEASDLDHPTVDEISPDYPPSPPAPPPPPRDVTNACVVLPQELPWVATISAVGPQKVLSFYSDYSNSKVDVTAPGGSSDQAPNPYGRVLNAWSSTAPVVNPNARREVEDCETVGGAPVCALYGWIQGTSMASPHAAGVAALIRAKHPNMPPMAVEAMLQNTAMPMSCPLDPRCTGGGQTNFYGNGLVDALAAGTR